MEGAAFLVAAGLAGLAARHLATSRPSPAPSTAPVAADDVAPEHLPVTHLPALYDDMAPRASPLLSRAWPRNQNFVAFGEEVLGVQRLHARAPEGGGQPAPPRALLAAGPCERIFWDVGSARAAIVTCGGLCPGLNTVIRELVMCLSYTYGLPRGAVLGVPGGFKGLYDASCGGLRVLTPDGVSTIQRQGGTVLGSSRGGFDGPAILEALEAQRISMVGGWVLPWPHRHPIPRRGLP